MKLCLGEDVWRPRISPTVAPRCGTVNELPPGARSRKHGPGGPPFEVPRETARSPDNSPTKTGWACPSDPKAHRWLFSPRQNKVPSQSIFSTQWQLALRNSFFTSIEYLGKSTQCWGCGERKVRGRCSLFPLSAHCSSPASPQVAELLPNWQTLDVIWKGVAKWAERRPSGEVPWPCSARRSSVACTKPESTAAWTPPAATAHGFDSTPR